MRIMFVMISMICVSCSIVILDMLNTFIKNYNHFKSNVNNILGIIYKNDQITCCYFKCTEMLVFPLVNMEMEAFEQTLSLQKDGDGGFCKNTSYWYSCI